MTKSIYCVGDPGPCRMDMLNIIRQFGIDPQRILPHEAIPTQHENEKPLLIIIGTDIPDRTAYITAIRERRDLAGIPILARLRKPADKEVESAMLAGADDVVVDGAEWHFGAFVAHLGKIEDWEVLRAPQGIAVVAAPDRQTRIHIASNLRKNGYDVLFASEPEELISAIPVRSPRIVVCDTHIAESALRIAAEWQYSITTEGIPWIIYGTVSETSTLSPLPGIASKFGYLRDIENTEQLTFVINEVVAPDKPEIRLTPRLLYGTTVCFGAENASPALWGYTYNVNSGGVYIRTLVPFQKGVRVQLRFKPPFSDSEIRGVGQVVWVRELADANGPAAPPGMGLQFVKWDEGHREMYEASYHRLRADQGNERNTMQAPTFLSMAGAISEPPSPAIVES